MVRLRKCELLEHQDFFFDKGTQYFVHKHCHRFLFMAMVIRDNGIGITHGLVFTTFAPDHHWEESHLFLTPAGRLNFIRLKASVILCKINLNNCLFRMKVLNFSFFWSVFFGRRHAANNEASFSLGTL